jgi:hypothetical protein
MLFAPCSLRPAPYASRLAPYAMRYLARRLVTPTCHAIAPERIERATAEAHAAKAEAVRQCKGRLSSAVPCYGGWKGGCSLRNALDPLNPRILDP